MQLGNSEIDRFLHVLKKNKINSDAAGKLDAGGDDKQLYFLWGLSDISNPKDRSIQP